LDADSRGELVLVMAELVLVLVMAEGVSIWMLIAEVSWCW